MSHIFISYSKHNRAYARSLADHLLAQGFDVWIDDRIDYGDNWWQTVVQAIEDCAAFIVIMTSEAEESRWVEREVALADDRHKPMFPILLAGQNWPLFIVTQYVNVTDGKLPPEDFYYRLAKYAPCQVQGENVTSKLSPALSDVLNILPGPFEWIVIPAGQVTLEDGHGLFDVLTFTIAKYPITYAQYQVFIDAPDGFQNADWWQNLATDNEYRSQPGEQYWKLADHPREMVSWYDAVAFCRWLSNKTSLNITLPTEMQWQRAAQGDENRLYPWGNQFEGNRCNTAESGIKHTTPVTRYPNGASPYGVIDMSGNTWEWCLNTNADPAYTDLDSETNRVVRGGSWRYDRDMVRVVFRANGSPGDRGYDIGFRVCYVPPYS